MGMPKDVGVIDTMLGFPHPDMKEVYRFITRQTKDTESKEQFDFPVEYMFKDGTGKAHEGAEDPVGVTVREMDLWGIEMGLIGLRKCAHCWQRSQLGCQFRHLVFCSLHVGICLGVPGA